MFVPQAPRFAVEIPSSLRLPRAPDIIPSSYQVTIAAYQADSSAADATKRPALNLLSGSPLTISWKLMAYDADACLVGPGEITFWNNVSAGLAPSAPVEMSEVFDTPVAEPADAAATRPTATPPGNSAPD